jgi:hypothetical protein
MYLITFYIPLEISGYVFKKHVSPSAINSTELIKTYIIGLSVGVIASLMGLTSLMHGWMNLGAELTRFGDRQFYTEFWNSKTYFEYYRKWNVIPHHFIHQYLYRDFRKIIPVKSLVFLLVMLSSSIIHEYVISFGVGHVFPILTIMYAGLGLVVVFVWPKNKMLQRISFIISCGSGISTLMWFNLVELRARELCPREEYLSDLATLRFIDCFEK